MYGVNAPLGLIPQSTITGATWNNQTRAYPVLSGYNQNLFKGDPVTTDATGGIVIWPGNGPCLGSFQGVFYTLAAPVNGQSYIASDFWTAGTVTLNANDAQALITDDPNVVFTCQTSQSNSGDNPIVPFGIARTNFGCNIQLNVAINNEPFAPVQPSMSAGTTYTPPNNPGSGSATNGGLSGYYADLNSMSNNANITFKIIGFDTTTNPGQLLYVAGPPTYGVFNNALLLINNHPYKGGTGTAGTGTVKTTGP